MDLAIYSSLIKGEGQMVELRELVALGCRPRKGAILLYVVSNMG